MNRLFFTSDTHFGHKKAAQFRGFDGDTDAMDEAMVRAWNSTVDKHDTVCHLGDVSFYGSKRTLDVLERLNGNIILVPGNHDEEMTGLVKMAFCRVVDSIYRLKVHLDGINCDFVMSHFPLMSWRGMHHGAMHLHGHCHGSLNPPFEMGKILDVGVDTPLGKKRGYAPIPLEEVYATLKDRKFVSWDQHKQAPETV